MKMMYESKNHHLKALSKVFEIISEKDLKFGYKSPFYQFFGFLKKPIIPKP